MVCVSESERINSSPLSDDVEGDLVRSYINGDDPSTILDIGCGPTLTVKGSCGLDMVEKGFCNPHVQGESVARYQHDLNKGKMPLEDETFSIVIARHILEHCIDVVAVLKDIHRVLKIDGKVIVCLPDERIGDTISMNPEHVHAFTLSSFVNLVENIGFRAVSTREGYNGVSFTVVLEKDNGN